MGEQKSSGVEKALWLCGNREAAGLPLCLKKQPVALRVIKACTRVGIRLENELILHNALKSFA